MDEDGVVVLKDALMRLRDALGFCRRYENVADRAQDPRTRTQATGGLDQRHELARQNPAPEREEFGDENVGPGAAECVEQDRPAPDEVGFIDRLEVLVEKG